MWTTIAPKGSGVWLSKGFWHHRWQCKSSQRLASAARQGRERYSNCSCARPLHAVVRSRRRLEPANLARCARQSCASHPPSDAHTSLRADIEQPLTRRNLIKPTDLFPKQAKDFDLYLVQPFNEVVQLALHGHADAMNPFE